MCRLFRAKGFTWILPVWHILVLVPTFDLEFVMTLYSRDTARSAAKVFNEGLYLNSENKLLRQVSVCLSFQQIFSEVFEVHSSNDGSNFIQLLSS